MKFATKPIRHYPPHLRHVATLPWKIQSFCSSADMEENTSKLHLRTDFNSCTRVTVYAECICVLTEQNRGRNPLRNFFSAHVLLWPNGWMDQDGTWHGGRPQPRGLCVRWGPSPPKFLVHVYYSYCDFVRTLHKRKATLDCSSLSSRLVFYAFYF